MALAASSESSAPECLSSLDQLFGSSEAEGDRCFASIRMTSMLRTRFLSTAARFRPRPKWTPSLKLTYALREIPDEIVTPSRWSPPLGGTGHLPFAIFRTPKGKQIPVYTDYRNGRTRCLTLVRRFRGDATALAEEMSRVCDDRPVTIRPGRVEVVGNYRGRIEEWLLRLGF